MAKHLSSNSGSACQVVVGIRVDWAGNPSSAPDNIPVKTSQTNITFSSHFPSIGQIFVSFSLPIRDNIFSNI